MTEPIKETVERVAVKLPTNDEMDPKKIAAETCSHTVEDGWADFPEITEVDEENEDIKEAGLYVGKPDKRAPIQLNAKCKGSVITVEVENEHGEMDMLLIDPDNTELVDYLLKTEDNAVKKQFCILCVTRNGNNFFWHVPEVFAGGHYDGNVWWSSAMTTMRDCGKLKKWFKLVTHRQGKDGKYSGRVVCNQEDKPVFTEGSFDTLIKIAFGDKIVTDLKDKRITENF